MRLSQWPGSKLREHQLREGKGKAASQADLAALRTTRLRSGKGRRPWARAPKGRRPEAGMGSGTESGSRQKQEELRRLPPRRAQRLARRRCRPARLADGTPRTLILRWPRGKGSTTSFARRLALRAPPLPGLGPAPAGVQGFRWTAVPWRRARAGVRGCGPSVWPNVWRGREVWRLGLRWSATT